MSLETKYDYKLEFFMSNFYHLFIIKVISCSNISACLFRKKFLMFEYKCVHLFSKTKCILKYKCMHVYARGYDMPNTDDTIIQCQFKVRPAEYMPDSH